jgi:metal-sulfur cluster biosynthetic enzyme
MGEPIREECTMATRENVIEVLKTVLDPELGIDIWNLGMIYEVGVDENGKVKIVMTLTTMGCPLFEELEGEIKEKVKNLQGVTDVDVQLVFNPPWTPEFMTEEGKLLLRYMF